MDLGLTSGLVRWQLFFLGGRREGSSAQSTGAAGASGEAFSGQTGGTAPEKRGAVSQYQCPCEICGQQLVFTIQQTH